jgi:formylglycine-generating enzyme required for sulfatase activity
MKWLLPGIFLYIIFITACQPSSPQADTTMISPVDNATLVFIPAGEFLMGSKDSDADADPDEKPQHTVYLDAFWIDRTEVSNDMYRRCVQAGGCTSPAHSRRYGPAEYGDHPALGISWNQAVAYCTWAGRRLPSEAEWEKAARGTDGRLYPWGEEAPDPSRLNFDHLIDDTSPVGSHPAGASPYGALDMAGNVWEWVADGYDENYYAESPDKNPRGGNSVNRRVLRGGSWNTQAHNVRVSNRFWGFPGRNDTDGFRCALSDQ